MLVLTRKVGEKIVIDGNITVEVVEVRGDRIRLGIVAPKETAVHRMEVYVAIHGTEPPSPDSTSNGRPTSRWRRISKPARCTIRARLLRVKNR